MKGTGQERMTLERLVEPKINGFAHPREFFLRKIGSCVRGKTSWDGDRRGRKTQEKVINKSLNADSGSEMESRCSLLASPRASGTKPGSQPLLDPGLFF